MKYLIANWKMNLNEDASLNLAKKYKKRLKGFKNLTIVIAPDLLYLKEIKQDLGKSTIKVCGQNVAAEEKGAYTGEVSAQMLKEIGCDFAIVGHSERRINLNETSELVNKKMNQCYNAGLVPILCVGETMEERLKGQTEAVLTRQLHGALGRVNGLPESDLFIAYEPVWAIGSGKNMDPSEFQAVYRIIKRVLSSLFSEKFYEEKVRLLYGGSVSSINAKDFWIAPHIHGLLVATGSLEMDEMYNIAMQAE
ncbi:MAG: triose-phosphate isomerase [Parcubacteria group bacterium]